MGKITPFQQALLDSALDEFAQVPNEHALSHNFSADFEAACKRLFSQNDTKVIYHLKKTVRRVALIAAILTTLTFTALASSEIRNSLFSLSNVTRYDAELAADAPESIKTVYLPSYIPKDFSLERKVIHKQWVTCLWRSDPETYITFDQYPIPQAAGSVLTSEDAVYEIIELDGYEVFRIQSSAIKYYWTDNQYFYTLIFSPNISEQEHRNVFYSITSVP